MPSPNLPFFLFLLASLLSFCSSTIDNLHTSSPTIDVSFGEAESSDGGDSHDSMMTYLVVVCRADGPREQGEPLRRWHASLVAPILNTTVGDLLSHQASRLMYSYMHVVSGFAARLSEAEVAAMAKHDWFVEAFPDRNYRLMTTYTPRLLGLSGGGAEGGGGGGLWSASNMGEGVIIGVLDNGIDALHASFGDEGMPPPPAKWKGECHFAGAACNRKLIGGRSQGAEQHGTHTASTATGAFVEGVAMLNSTLGVASGMAPRAHLAFYEICLQGNCSSTYLLTVSEKGAYRDGVDVLSISAGDEIQEPFYRDLIAVGSYSAVSGGTFVSTTAGNFGPTPGTVTNCAPWVLTAAASTASRRVLSVVRLGDGQEFYGESIVEYTDVEAKPVVFVEGKFSEAYLKGVDVRGKIVLCDRTEAPVMRSEMVSAAGGAGMISMSGPKRGNATTPLDHFAVAASRVCNADGEKIKAYVNSTSNPTASLHFRGIEVNTSWVPAVAEYSSRGPCNMSNIGILKPDITAPGSNIVAAAPGNGSAAHRARTFGLMSGTSMAAPHLSGIAAVLKKAHPDWSPAAIKSAMMTTADAALIDETTRKQASYFAMGAGLVNPRKAVDPGLVYDISAEDYIPYICGLGYQDNYVNEIIAHPVNVSCSQVHKIEGKDLNYPSIMVSLPLGRPHAEVKRTVTNVGDGTSVYDVEIGAPEGVLVEVRPARLECTQVNQKASYTVTFRRIALSFGTVEGHLQWVSGKRVVRSPIVVSLDL